MALTYKKATIEDLEILTETRICVLRAANKLADDVDMTEVREQSYAYYKKALNDDTHLSQSVGVESLHNEYVHSP